MQNLYFVTAWTQNSNASQKYAARKF